MTVETSLQKSKSGRAGAGVFGGANRPNYTTGLQSPMTMDTNARAGDSENRPMLYSVKNHQLYHSHKL